MITTMAGIFLLTVILFMLLQAGGGVEQLVTHVTLNPFVCSNKQECIPVGCIPSAAVAISWGVSALGGVCSWGGVCFLGGVCSGGVYSGEVSTPRGVYSGGCLLWGVSAPGGMSAQGSVCLGVSAPGGWYPSMH